MENLHRACCKAGVSTAKDKTTTLDGHNGMFLGPENTREDENGYIKFHASYVEVNVTIKAVKSVNNRDGLMSHTIVVFRTERLKSTT